MPPETHYNIIATTSSGNYEKGALMMVNSEPWITLGFDYYSCLKAFDGPCKETYVIENGKEMMGFVILQVCGTFNGYIQTICIHEKYRGRGLGKKMLQYCEERIYRTSPNVFICVSAFNQEAIRLYISLGFTQVGVLQDFVKEGFDELLLRKTIGPRLGYTGSGLNKP